MGAFDPPASVAADGPTVRHDVGVPTDPYRAIRNFWGENLHDALIDRIDTAPVDHLDEFFIGYPDSGMSDLPVLAAGHIRPLVSAATQDRIEHRAPFQSVVPTLLLYAHELVIDDPLPETLLSRMDAGGGIERLSGALRFLLDVQPLFDQGLIHFRPVSSAKRHPSAELFTRDGCKTLRVLLDDPDSQIRASTVDLAHEFTDSLSILGAELTGVDAVLRMVAEDVGMHVANERRFGGQGRVNPLFRSRIEMTAYEAMGGHFGPRDRRLASLASLAVPDFGDATKELVRVREDSDSFADWRQALANGLDQCHGGMLSEDSSVRLKTRSDFVDELAPYRDRLQAEVERSSYLRSIRVGAKQFGVGAVTGAAGFAAGGSIASALASGAAGATITTLKDHLATRSTARKNTRVATLAMAFLRETE